MSHLRTVSLGLVALLAIGGAILFGLKRSQTPSLSPDAPRLSASASASSAPSAASSPRPAEASEEHIGVILARSIVELAPRFEGRLLEVHVRLGDRVAKGDAIATMDAPSLKYELRVAEANLKAAGVEKERVSVELAEAAERLKRRESLSAEALVSNEDLKSAGYQHKVAQTRVSATDAQLAERRAQVDKLRTDSADTVIRAPFSGIIAARYADPGANVSPTKSIVRLVSTDDFFLRFAVPGDRAAHLRSGDRVKARIGEHRLEVQGTIDKIAPEIDAASRMIVVEAKVSGIDSNAQLLSGEIARVELESAP